MLKRILIVLLISLSTAYGQFVATDNFDVKGGKQTVENYTNHQHGEFIEGPVTLNVKWEGSPTNLKVELKHDGNTLVFYPSDLDNSFTVRNITAFSGDKWSGNWQLKIDSDTCFTVTEWAVVPEPTTTGIIVSLGLLGFVGLRKKLQ
jgi:hypothetical protein